MEKIYDVTALGELLIDFTENGISAQGNPLLEANPGGAPCNVLAMLEKLGKKTAFVGKVGKDMFGEQLKTAVEEVGIDTRNLVMDEEVHTTLAFVHTYPDGDRDFSFYRNPGADMMLKKEEVDEDLIRGAKIFHFGTLSSTHEGVREATRYAIDVAKEAGCIVSFDPNLRPPLWKSLDEAKAEIEYGLSKCDILKISDNEVEFLFGTTDYDEGARLIREKYQIPLVLITLGKDGSRAYYKDLRVEVPGFVQEHTIETTGAGDTFCANSLNYILEHGMEELTEENLKELAAARTRLERFSVNFDVRKMAACTKHGDHTFYILCGWMSETDAKKFQKEIESDADTFCIMEDNHNNIMSTPPTKMKNPGLFKPFEMYVEMYGLPSYNEIDPTILIGITYSILFGFMFGDAGQGLCLLIGGFLLYKFKKMRLAGIISCCGFFSTIFGVLFGSVFGFEDIIDAVWLRPQEAMTDLPFIGKLNTVFVVAIAIGMGIILLCMILNIINSVKEHNTEKTWFDTNGAAGLVFYFALATVIVLYMSGNALPATIVLTVLFIIPLLLMFFKEPLSAMVEKKAQKMEGGVGMFITQGVFELFEVLLSYFSNTLSFVRVGAFAVSHAAMMQVVLMLAGAEAGSPNWAVVIGGNLFVCGMEGLIVGIQVLRLEYYELFSRFYRGSGRAFEPYGKH